MSTSTRQWQNIAKYFFDISKLIFGIIVISQFASKEPVQWIIVAFGTGGGVMLFIIGLYADKKGETK